MPAQKYTAEDVALSLTLAVVSSSPAPLLLLDGQLTVIAASLSFCDAFEGNQADLTGQALFNMANREWDVPQLRALMTTIISGDAITDPAVVDFKRPQRPTLHLLVQAKRLAYLDLAQTRILVAVSDVTEARADAVAKEDTLRQNSVLLQEVRHRVANSLQIVASVLLQNARMTDSDDIRDHLKDAHHRIMSVAALERLLSISQDGDVEVQAYFKSLCDNITTSMIGERDQVTLTVQGEEGVVAARVAVSLGLIVTELVINALKHAFPDGRPGKIKIDYNFHGPNWILCVRDDGVGMPPTGVAMRTGLGTSIVQALAKTLQASVEIGAQSPGTEVSIRHDQITLVQDEPQAATEPPATADPPTSAISG